MGLSPRRGQGVPIRLHSELLMMDSNHFQTRNFNLGDLLQQCLTSYNTLYVRMHIKNAQCLKVQSLSLVQRPKASQSFTDSNVLPLISVTLLIPILRISVSFLCRTVPHYHGPLWSKCLFVLILLFKNNNSSIQLPTESGWALNQNSN